MYRGGGWGPMGFLDGGRALRGAHNPAASAVRASGQMAIDQRPSPASRTRPPLPAEDGGAREGRGRAVRVRYSCTVAGFLPCSIALILWMRRAWRPPSNSVWI